METSKKKGFTLIELMIVIIIIGILATIMIIAYNSIVAKSRKAATVQALNDSIQGVATCIAGGGTANVNPSNNLPQYDTPVCVEPEITTARWPKVDASGNLNGYNVGANLPVYNTTTRGYDYNTRTIHRSVDGASITYDIKCMSGGQCQ